MLIATGVCTMPKHIRRLLLLIAAFAVLAVATRFILVDKSFYQFGHYRGAAVAEIAHDKPKYQGTEFCRSCHAAPYAAWSTGVHNRPLIGKTVKCEVCHGAGGGRDAEQDYVNATTGPIHPANLKLTVPRDTRAVCTLCHERIVGRPVQQAQVVTQDHAASVQCILCHNPHSPRTFVGATLALEHRGSIAVGKLKSEACAGCHGADGVSAGLPGPTLAGQDEAYLVNALRAYKTGKRDNPMMSPMVADMSDDELVDVAAYFSSLKCTLAPVAQERVAAAQTSGASVCTSCHGFNGAGALHIAPHLAGQSKDYLAEALRSYASGARPHPVMTALGKTLSDQALDNVATFYAGATCN